MIMVPSPTPTKSPFDRSPDQLVAGSAGWLALTLNLGCQGMGYVYQRRWRAYWIGALATLSAGLALGGLFAFKTKLDMDKQPNAIHIQMYGEPTIVAAFVMGAYAGCFAVGIGSAVEAGMAVKRARQRSGR